MRQVLVIKYDDRSPSHGYLVSFSNLILCAIGHPNLEWNAFHYCGLNLNSCHTLLSHHARSCGLVQWQKKAER